MADITFQTNISWNGTGRDGKGKVTLDKRPITFSSPAEMGGKGVGTSPEDLLISAVATCYSGTLNGILTKNKFPVQHIEVRAEGIVTGYPLQTKFEQLIVHPTIIGGDHSMLSDYEKAAAIAKEKCFIGKSIAGNIEYKVGTVKISSILLEQNQVDEVVENFYIKLTKNDYFSTMFAERNVDIEKLKERQKVFITRLINETMSTREQEHKDQVKERHPFHTTPERADIWLGTMESTMNDMEISHETKDLLLSRMRTLMDTMIKK